MEMEQKTAGMNMKDSLVLRAFKSMGISEQTLEMVEKDLRDSMKNKEVNKEVEEIKQEEKIQTKQD